MAKNVLVGQIVVRVVQIAGADCVVVSAWEPSTYTGRHHTVTRPFDDDRVFGRMGSDGPTDAEIGGRKGDERIAFVSEFYRRRRIEAVVAIRLAFPGLDGVDPDTASGEFSLSRAEAARAGVL